MDIIQEYAYKISVIVPVYNSKKEDILKSFNSIYSQTIGFSNLEVFFVDDASDYKESFPILRELNDKYTNVTTIFLQENKGSGNARNVGIDKSKGKYIMFLDHDDYFFRNSCEILFNTIEKENVDIVCGNYINQQRGGKINWSNINLPYFTKVNNVNENINLLRVDPSIWTKIYKNKFLNSNNLRYKNFRAGQDLIFNQQTLFKAEGIVFIDEAIVNYAVRTDSDERLSSMSVKNSKEVLESLLNVYLSSYDLFLENNNEASYIPLTYLNYFVNRRLSGSNLSYDEFKSILKPFSFFFTKYLENDNVKKIQKYGNFFKYVSEKHFEEAYDIYVDVVCMRK